MLVLIYVILDFFFFFLLEPKLQNHQCTICQTFLCGNMWPLLAKGKIWQDSEKAITSTGIWNNK